MQYFKVLYDFEGTDENELTVSAGDYLSSDADYNPDDWVQCTILNTTSQGFVPGSYISPIPEHDLPSSTTTSPADNKPSVERAEPIPEATSPHATPKSAPNPSRTSTLVSDLLLRSERFSKSSLSRSPALTASRLRSSANNSILSSSRVRMRDTQQRLRSRFSHSQNTDKSCSDLIQKHEQMYKEICENREYMFNDLDKLMNDALDKVRTNKESARKALDYLEQVEKYVDEEKKKFQLDQSNESISNDLDVLDL
ncbi:hypothetical protein P9112_000614 [Eukaryota sp. TZLM1-RC]